MTVVSINGSRISPRCSVSDSAWRTCSPTRSMRWDGPVPEFFDMVPILKSCGHGIEPRRMFHAVHQIIGTVRKPLRTLRSDDSRDGGLPPSHHSLPGEAYSVLVTISTRKH